MARNDTVAFRREFTTESDGFLGDSKGMFVGDILSLHVDIVSKKASIVIEARIGKGDWRKIANVPNAENLNYVDLRDYEYVRVKAFNIMESTKVILFGYDSPIKEKEITVIQTKMDNDRDIENNVLLNDILKELKKVSTQLSFITEEDI